MSQLRAAKAAGQPTTPHFHVPLYGLLRGIDQPTGGDEYRRIVEALKRLSATLLRTNIRQGKKKRPEGFHWIERYSAPTDYLGRSTGVEFTILNWLYEGVLTDRLVLGIDRAYVKLTGGTERWLYRVVRKHSGHQVAGGAFTMKQLHHKSGSTQRLADFAKGTAPSRRASTPTRLLAGTGKKAQKERSSSLHGRMPAPDRSSWLRV